MTGELKADRVMDKLGANNAQALSVRPLCDRHCWTDGHRRRVEFGTGRAACPEYSNHLFDTACDALISSQSIWEGHDFLVKVESRLASTFGAVEGSRCLRRPGHPEWMVSTSVRRPYSQSPKPAARVQARIQRSTGASGLGLQDCCETLVTLIGHS